MDFLRNFFGKKTEEDKPSKEIQRTEIKEDRNVKQDSKKSAKDTVTQIAGVLFVKFQEKDAVFQMVILRKDTVDEVVKKSGLSVDEAATQFALGMWLRHYKKIPDPETMAKVMSELSSSTHMIVNHAKRLSDVGESLGLEWEIPIVTVTWLLGKG